MHAQLAVGVRGGQPLAARREGARGRRRTCVVDSPVVDMAALQLGA